VLSGQRLFANPTIDQKRGTEMAAKRPKSSKSGVLGNAVVKKVVPFANPPHHPYEAKIYNAVDGMLIDAQAILTTLNQNPNDGNKAPTVGMIDRLNSLLLELKYGSTNQTTHDQNIEGILYAIAQIGDQYNIGGHAASTQAYPPPTGGTHEGRVLRLLTTIDSICREIFQILEAGLMALTPQPTGTTGNSNNIVAMAKDIQKVLKKISRHIVDRHGGMTIFSK
jgi:hypothetical protein